MATTRRRLILVWLGLMSLTLAMAFVGDVAHTSRLGAVWMMAIAIVTAIKARFVLADYLGLRTNPMALAGFTAAVVATLTAVVGAFLVAGS